MKQTTDMTSYWQASHSPPLIMASIEQACTSALVNSFLAPAAAPYFLLNIDGRLLDVDALGACAGSKSS